MAGDWIKMTKDLPDKPEVWRIAGMVGIDADAVVGKLLRVWSWFDSHTENGNACGVTYPLLDRIAGVDGFAEAMALAGWLTQHGHTMTVPHFDRHNGKTAKNRALTNERVGKMREKQRNEQQESNAATVTETVSREEKRREEKEPRKRASPVVCPDDVSEQVWVDWLSLRTKKRAPVTLTVLDEARKEADKASLPLDAFLRVWCRRGSQGLEASWLKADERASFSAPPPSDKFAGAL